jgi:subtilisin-like proprotein convertase family protein
MKQHYPKNKLKNYQIKNIFKSVLIVLLLTNTIKKANAQVELINTNDGSFENATSTFAANGWSTAQGTGNRVWRVGTPAGANTGTKAAYTGNASTYNGINLNRVNHFYRDIAIPVGAQDVQLKFYYRQPLTDETFDFFYASTTTTANTPIQGVIPDASYDILFTNTATVYDAFTLIGPFDLTALAGTTVRLVFSIESDGVDPASNPSIDDVSITYIPSGYNMGVSGFSAPLFPACYNSNETITATIINSGNEDLDLSVTPLTIDAVATGMNPSTFPSVVLNSGTFVAGTSQDVIIATGYDMSLTGIYNIAVTTTVANDASTNNDTYTMAFEKVENPIPVVTPLEAFICEGGSTSLTVAPETVVNSIDLTNNTVTLIPDNTVAGINSTITASGATTANALISFTLNVEHSFVADLIVDLTAPDGSTINITNQAGDLGADFISTVFTDTALTPIASGVAPFTGYFLPEQLFSTLTGTANGVWTLHISDNANLDEGNLLSWSISLQALGGIASYSWSPSTGLSSLFTPTTIANPTITTNYDIVLTNNAGCVGYGAVTVNVNPIYNMTQTLSLCEGDSITIGTNTYTADGIYTDLLQSISGCDSTVVSDISFNAPSFGSQTLTLCSGDSIVVGSNAYNTSGIYTDILTSSVGCDSTVTTNLTVLPSANLTQSFTICAGDSIIVGSNVYNSTGIYTDIVIAANGCDSVITSNLTVLPTITNSNTLSLCSGDSIVVGSNSYNTTGIYTDILIAASGCDSIVTTNLTILQVLNNSQTISLCFGDSIIVGSHVYNVTGIYKDTLIAIAGCDSIITTNLTMLQSLSSNQTLSICAGDSIMVGTNVYNASGVYTDTFVSSFGCDSIVSTNLTVLNAINYTQSLTICNGDSVIVGTNFYTLPGVYTDVINNGSGCDSTITTTVIVNQNPVVTFVPFTSTFCIQNPAVALTGGSPVGGTYSGAGIVTSPNFNASNAGLGNHSIMYSFTDNNGCSASATQSLTVTDCTGLEEFSLENAVSITPNPSNGLINLSILKAQFETLQIVITDMQGKVVYSVSDKNVNSNYFKTLDFTNEAKGLYFINIIGDQKTASLKFIIE